MPAKAEEMNRAGTYRRASRRPPQSEVNADAHSETTTTSFAQRSGLMAPKCAERDGGSLPRLQQGLKRTVAECRGEVLLSHKTGPQGPSQASCDATLGTGLASAAYSAQGHSRRCQSPALAAGYPPNVYQISPLDGQATLA